MKSKAIIATIFVSGVVWALSEIYLGDLFYRFHIPMRAAVLTAVGMTILVISRLLCDRLGVATGSAILAGVIRCLVPRANICHLVAIALQGFIFDLIWTAVKAGEKRSLSRAWLSAISGSYLGSFGFVVLSIYFFKFGRWVAAGFWGGTEWAIKTGSMASLLLSAFVPSGRLIALRVGLRLKSAGLENNSMEASRQRRSTQ